MKGGSGWVLEIRKMFETELQAAFYVTFAAALHSLKDFFTLLSFYSRIFICIVVNFILLLQAFRYFFTHINFVKLQGGGQGHFTLVFIGNKRVSTSTEINLYNLKKILQNVENLKGTVQRDGSGRNQAHSIGLF